MNNNIEQKKTSSLESILQQTKELLSKHKKSCEAKTLSLEEKKEIIASMNQCIDSFASDFVAKNTKKIEEIRSVKESDKADTMSHYIDALIDLINTYTNELEALKSKETEETKETTDDEAKSLKKDLGIKDSIHKQHEDAVDAAKKESEKLQEDLIKESIKKSDATRVGKYLVSPYLTSKYIRKEKQSQRYERAMKGAITLIGLGDISGRLQGLQENLTKKIGELKKQHLPNENKEKPPIEKLKEKLHDKKTIEERKGHLRTQCEKVTGKKINHVEFDAFIEKRLESHKQERQQLIDHYDKLKKESKENITFYNPLDESFRRGTHEAKAPFELFRGLVGDGYLSAGDIATEQVEVGGKTIIRYGLAFGGLVYNGLSTVIGAMPIEEFSGYVQSKLNININGNSRMLLRGIMYRHGGLFTNAIATVGHATTAMASMMMQNNTDSISKRSAFIKGGLLNQVETQIKTIDQLEHKMRNSGLFKDMPGELDDIRLKSLGLKPGLTHMTAILEQAKLNTLMVDAQKSAKTPVEFIAALNKHPSPLNTQLIDNLTANVGGDLDTFNKSSNYKEVLKGSIAKNMSKESGLMSEMQKKIGRTQKIGSTLGVTNINKRIESEFIEQMSGLNKLQQKMIANDSVSDLFSLKKRRNGRKFVELCTLGDKNVLYLKRPQDVAEYFDEINQVIKQTPAIAKTLLTSLPILMVGKEVAEAIDPNKGVTDAGYQILKGVGSLMPLVGPMMLLHNSLDQKGEVKGDVAGMALGGIMLGLDGVTMVGSIGKGFMDAGISGAGKAFRRGMLAPLRDTRNILTAGGKTLCVSGRLFIHGLEMLRKDPKGLAKASTNLIKRIGLRVGIAGGIAIGLGYLGSGIYEDIMNDTTIDETQKKLAKQLKENPQKLEEELQKTRPTLKPEQKAEIARFALAKQAGIGLEMLPAGGTATGSTYNIEVDPLGRSPRLKDYKQEIEEHISKLEGKPIKIDFYFANTDRCVDQYKQFIHKELFGDKEKKTAFDPKKVEEYMLSQGYPETSLAAWQKPDSEEVMATIFRES